jgi:hypothetical protein
MESMQLHVQLHSAIDFNRGEAVYLIKPFTALIFKAEISHPRSDIVISSANEGFRYDSISTVKSNLLYLRCLNHALQIKRSQGGACNVIPLAIFVAGTSRV